MKITGAKAHAFFGSSGADSIISGDSGAATEAGVLYRIISKGENSTIRLPVNFPFRAPAAGTQITLVSGDRLEAIDETRYCKTTASVQSSQGTIDVGDDCDTGATILDGIVTYTGSLGSLFNYDRETGNFHDVTETVVNRFFDIIDDDSAGIYTLSPRTDDPIHLLICLNSNAQVGQIENWLYIPINISEMSINLGNTEAQGGELSWSKGEGAAVVYRRIKTEE